MSAVGGGGAITRSTPEGTRLFKMSETRAIHPWVAAGETEVRFAVVGAFVRGWEPLRDLVIRCEALGFDAYWMNDHPNRSMDPWTALAALGALTNRLRLISLVSCIYYRSPLLLARQVADVDQISGGRAVLGLGIGDDVPEFSQMGIEFPGIRRRQAALEEMVEVVAGLLRGEHVSYDAPDFSLTDARIAPVPVQEPHVPIIIGGGGEKVTLRQVARYADVANFGPHEWVGSAFTIEDVVRKYAALRQHCDDLGRPFASILRSHWTPLLTLARDSRSLEEKRRNSRIPDASLRLEPLFATPEQAIAHYQALAEAGVQYFLATVNGQDHETLELLASEVMPELRPNRTL
jgi:alkanesulfonate monooxygenase SsuD/methylene tetrahydromethanopterin reductase-like flavin-dependent oxidoreductase (luciferase family)